MQVYILSLRYLFNKEYVKMRRNFFILTVLSFFLLVSGGCGRTNRFQVDLNAERVPVEVQRFDEDLLAVDTARIMEEVVRLADKYPDFFPVYVETILGTQPQDTTEIAELLMDFLTDTTFTGVNRKVLKDYKNISDIESSFSDAYTYIHHYFPDIDLPEIYFYVSGFNLSIMMNDNIAGMGTDLYLGADYELYHDFTYEYMTHSMNRENIVPDLISALLFREFRMDTDKDRLIDHMLYRGKVMYLVSIFIPGLKDQYLMGYTEEQAEWCHHYERQIWASVIDQKHLFSTDHLLIRKYLNDAPFTSPVSQDSPGRLGTWVGYRIIESYMNQNENVTLQELMAENDYQKVLENSGYRP